MSDVSTRVEAFLTDLGEFRKQSDDLYLARRGSAVVAIRVEALEGEGEGESDHLVHVEATVVEGASLGADIMRQLLEFNYGSAFGAFGIDEAGAVTVHHTMLGSGICQEELQTAVVEVARIADDWDDVIVDLAGGKTAVDRLQERLNRPQPTIAPPAAAAGGDDTDVE